MLKVTVLALFVVSCTCQQVLEVTGDKVVKTDETHLPLRTVGGIHGISAFPYGSSYGSSYGHSYSSGIPAHFGNLGYLSELRQKVLGGGHYLGHSLHGANALAIRQPHLGIGYHSVGYHPAHYSVGHAISQPAISIAHQPAIHLTRHAGLAIAQPHVGFHTAGIHTAGVHQQVHPVTAAIHQVGRTVEYRPVPFSDQPIQVQDVVVEPSDQPINIHFKSRSSTVRVSQEHIPGEPGTVEQTQSQDEPHRAVHEVVKPVVQEVKEVIQPYRQVTQEIQPVVENVHTIVAHGEGQRAQYVAQPNIAIQKEQVVAVRPQAVNFAVSQPVVHQAVRHVAVEQPAIHAVGVNQVRVAQPIGYGIRVGSQPIGYGIGLGHQAGLGGLSGYSGYGGYRVGYGVGVPQTIGYGVRVAQPVVGVRRVVENEPSVVRTEELREAREAQEFKPEIRAQTGTDYMKYVEQSQ